MSKMLPIKTEVSFSKGGRSIAFSGDLRDVVKVGLIGLLVAMLLRAIFN